MSGANDTLFAKVDPIYISDQFHPGSDFCIRTNPGKNMEYVTKNSYIDGGKPQEGQSMLLRTRK